MYHEFYRMTTFHNVTRSMPAGHWRAFSTKGIEIDSNLLPFVRGNHPRSSTGSQIHFPEQGFGSKTLCVTLLRPSVHTQDLPRRPVSPRGIEVSDPCSQDPGGKNRISLATPPSDHLNSLGHYYIYICLTGALSSWSSGACGDL